MKITARDLFGAAARIVGILTIIKGIQVLIMTIPTILGLYGQGVPDWALNQKLITIIYPLALFLIGFYLLAGINGLLDKLYPNAGEEALASSRGVFILAMRITGMVLIVYGIPELLEIISGLLYAGYYQRYGINAAAQIMLAAERSLAVVVSLLFGFYLLKGGRYFEKLAGSPHLKE